MLPASGEFEKSWKKNLYLFYANDFCGSKSFSKIYKLLKSGIYKKNSVAQNLSNYFYIFSFEEKGVEFVKKLDEGRTKGLAFIKDPDGYWIEIFNPNTLLEKIKWIIF